MGKSTTCLSLLYHLKCILSREKYFSSGKNGPFSIKKEMSIFVQFAHDFARCKILELCSCLQRIFLRISKKRILSRRKGF